MITTMQMYWLVTLDSIVIASVIVSIIIGVIAAMSVAAVLDGGAPLRVPVILSAVTAFFLAVATFTPNTKQMAAIIMVPKIANSEKVQEAGSQLYNLAVEWMDELRPAKKDPAKEEAK